MDIPGEDLPGSYPATALVGWYNGQPDYHHLHFNLSSTTSVFVIGNGNVAMDVTRILARSPSELAHTDITSYALATLQQSTVEEIVVCGRRGPAQAAFTNPEIRELTELQGVDLIVQPEDLTLDAITQQFLTAHASEPTHQRNLEILKGSSPREKAPNHERFACISSPHQWLSSDETVSKESASSTMS